MTPANRGPRLTGEENAIIRNGVLSGKTSTVIASELQAKGFNRTGPTVGSSKAWADARMELKEGGAVDPNALTDYSPIVVFDDLVIRREVRTVSVLTLNGIVRDIPVSLSGGASWQVPA